MEGRINYSMLDEDTGECYNIFITEQEAASLTLDKLKYYQKLLQLKRQGVKPTSVSPPSPPPAAPSRPKTAKNGAKWRGNATSLLVNACVPYRKWLRLRPVPVPTWHSITEALAKDGLSFSWEQVKEKVRNLKRTYKEAKEGAHSGDKWAHFWLMTYIFDSAINEGEVTLAPKDFLSQSTSAVIDTELLPSDFAGKITTSSPIPVDNGQQASSAEEELGFEVNNNQITDEKEEFSNMVHQSEEVLAAELIWEGEVPIIMPDQLGEPLAEIDHRRLNIPPSVLHSPAKKKVKQAALTVNILKSPHRQSPKRKQVTKQALDWDPKLTEAFITECVKRKGDIQKNTIPVGIWKDICEILEKNHKISVAWNMCREKFSRMKDFFMDSMLPVEGNMANRKWPYYDNFCELFDIPLEYHSLVMIAEGDENSNGDSDTDEEEGTTASNTKGKKLWTLPVMELFLDLYQQKKTEFDSTKSFLKHSLLYAEISQQMRDFGIMVSGKQCLAKLGRLKEHFRKEYDSANRTGAAPCTWPLYDRMMKMFKGSASLEPPFSVSVGRGLRYCEKGVPAPAAREGSRTRPATKDKKIDGKAIKKPIFKTWQQEATENKIIQQTRIADEMQLMRLTLEKNRADRKDFQAKLLEKL